MDQDRRNQERERLQREREEKRLKAAKEEEEFQKELKERKKQREEQRRLREADRQRAEEEHQIALEERRKKRERDRLKILAGIVEKTQKSQISIRPFTRPKTQSPLSLFKSMKSIYQIAPHRYFTELVSKIPEEGEITRFFENFNQDLTKPGTFYKFPIRYYGKYTSSSDRDVLLRFIDAQDEDGFTALHWAAFNSNSSAAEELLKLGANPNVKTLINKHTPIDKISGNGSSMMHELFRKYKDINTANQTLNRFNKKIAVQNDKMICYVDSSTFPFLELPTELQLIILEQLSIGTMLTVQCVCRHFKALQISNKHVAELPEMGKFKFLDPPVDSWFNKEKQCALSIFATPTVFHFGMIMGHVYQPPANAGSALVLDRLIARIEKFAVEDGTWKYDLEKLRRFLLNKGGRARKIYVFGEDFHYAKESIYVELDHSFGVGIDFRSPGDPVAYEYDNAY